MILGDLLRKYRMAKNYSQKDLSNIIGCERASINKYENYKVNMSLNRFIKFCDVLDIPSYEILRVVIKDRTTLN